MNEPPNPNDPVDPNDLTQPMTRVPSPDRPVERVETATPAPALAIPAQPIVAKTYVPTFGNLGAYLFARLIAILIDLVAIPYAIACFVFNASDRGVLALAPRTAEGFGTIAAVSFGAALVFAILCEAIFETTLGKALFALGVRRYNGKHPSLLHVFVRYLLLPLDVLLIGPLLALVMRRHQRVGDLLSGTVVARNRIGGVVTVFALVLFGGIVYAQATLGGGLTSALAVLAETSFYGPQFVGNVASHLGVGSSAVVVPAALPSDQSSPPERFSSPDPALATPAPTDVPSGSPTSLPSVAPATPLPVHSGQMNG